jgi:predicted transcriptional regulator
MSVKLRKIEVDTETAATLEARAAERGLSVSELLAEMTALQERPAVLSSEEIAELDGQWAAVKAGEPTVPHEEVVRWLQTWGTPAFRPWQNR